MKKLLLASNILEHSSFPAFVRQAGVAHPDADLLVSGDLLNVFPEPGEDLEGSIFHEIYGGGLITREMNRLVGARFRDVASSEFLAPLRDMFLPTGSRNAEAEALAERRYVAFRDSVVPELGKRRFHFIPGNMDYPRTAERIFATAGESFQMLDQQVVTIGGLRVGGLGGVPNTVHPFRGVTEISPYEMTEAEYGRRLQNLRGVDILVTHLSPAEYQPLYQFLLESPVQLLICRAPFDFTRASDFRGKLEIETLKGSDKRVIRVRPYDAPVNQAFVIGIENGRVSDDVETFVSTAA